MKRILSTLILLGAFTVSAQVAQNTETFIPTPNYGQAEAAPFIDNTPIAGTKALWDIIASMDVTTTANNTVGQAAVAYIGNEIWTSQWASDTIIRFTAAGTFIAKFVVPGVAGCRSIAYNGANVYIANATNNIYEVSPVLYTLSGIITSAAPVTSRFLTYDATLNGGAGGFWTGNFNTDIVAISMSGAVLATIPAATHTLTGMYGAAVDNSNASGPYLWVYHQAGANNCQLTALALPTGTPTVYTRDVYTDIAPGQSLTSGLAGGAFISTTFSLGQLSLLTLTQGTPVNVVAVYDIEIIGSTTDVASTTLRPTEGYTKIPLTQIFSETFVAGYQNLSTNTIPEINGELSFYYNGGLVGTENFQATNVASGATGTFTSAGFAMSNGVGDYDVEFVVTPDAGSTDGNSTNDTLVFSFQVTDSIYARDNGVSTGTGYTVSATDSAYAASLFEVYATDIATGIWIQLEAPADGDSTFALIFESAGGLVLNEVARGTLQLISAAQNTYYLTFPTTVTLTPGTYAFAVYEGVGVGIGLSQSNNVYTAGTNFFNVGGTWTASGIQTARFIRPVFGTEPFSNLDENETNDLLVYPVPATEFIEISLKTKLAEAGTVSLIDLNGRTVLSQELAQGANSAKLSLNTIQKGSYVLIVNTGSTELMRKIIVQ